MDALGVERIPASTTSGDFLRRFDESSVSALMDAINEVRKGIWRSQPEAARRLALIDVDGTLVPTLGQLGQHARGALRRQPPR